MDTIIGEEGLTAAGVPLEPALTPRLGVDRPGTGARGRDHQLAGNPTAELRDEERRQEDDSVDGGPSSGRYHHQRGLSFFADESVADTIIKSDII